MDAAREAPLSFLSFPFFFLLLFFFLSLAGSGGRPVSSGGFLAIEAAWFWHFVSGLELLSTIFIFLHDEFQSFSFLSNHETSFLSFPRSSRTGVRATNTERRRHASSSFSAIIGGSKPRQCTSRGSRCQAKGRHCAYAFLFCFSRAGLLESPIIITSPRLFYCQRLLSKVKNTQTHTYSAQHTQSAK